MAASGSFHIPSWSDILQLLLPGIRLSSQLVVVSVLANLETTWTSTGNASRATEISVLQLDDVTDFAYPYQLHSCRVTSQHYFTTTIPHPHIHAHHTSHSRLPSTELTHSAPVTQPGSASLCRSSPQGPGSKDACARKNGSASAAYMNHFSARPNSILRSTSHCRQNRVPPLCCHCREHIPVTSAALSSGVGGQANPAAIHSM